MRIRAIQIFLIFFVVVISSIATGAPRSIVFDGKLEKLAPSIALQDGSVKELRNVQRPNPTVPLGWDRRTGNTKYNTTAIASDEVKGIFQYVNAEHDIHAFYAQCGDAIYTGSTSPPSEGTFLSSTASGREAHNDGNAASDPYGNESGTTTGFTHVGLDSGNSFYANPTAVAVGSYSLCANGNEAGAPPMDTRFYKDIGTDWSLVDGGRYTISFSWRHVGAGGDWFVRLASSTNGASGQDLADMVESTDTTFVSVTYTFTYSTSYRYLVFKEHGGTNDGGVYVDNLSLREHFDYSMDSGTSPLFGERINDDMVWAGTGTTPFAYSGGATYPDAFLVKHETGTTLYVDGWDRVRDKRQDTNISLVAHSGASEMMYWGFRRRLDGFTLDVLSGGTEIGGGVTLEARRSGTWTAVSNLTTLSTDTRVVASWDASIDDDPYLLPGTKTHLYWYRSGVTNDVTDGIKAWRVRINDRMEEMTNLWSGYYDIALGCLLSSVTGYTDYSGEVTDGTDAEYVDVGGLTTSYALYVGFANPAFGIKLNIVPENPNLGTSCTLSTVKYWDGSNNTWTSVGTIQDGTSYNGYALGQSGTVQWDGGSIHEDKRVLGGILTPLYWYELKWSVTLPSDVYIWEVAQLEKPSTIPPFPKYDGVIESNGYAVYWPGNRFKNGLDFAQMGYPYIKNGPLQGQSGPIFGPGTVNAVTRISDYLIVSTKNPYRLYFLEGKVPGKWDSLNIASTVGAVGPHAMITIEDAVRRFSTTKSVHAGILMSHDGVYLAERVVINISGPIANYWDTGSTPYIEPDYMQDVHAWIDYRRKLVLFAVPMHFDSTQTTKNVILPYNYLTDEWYDIWMLADDASCGIDLIGNDDQRMAYMGDYNGYVHRMNTGADDNSTKIDHYLVTSDIINPEVPGALNYQSILRSVKIKAKTCDSGDVEVVTYPDGHKSGVTLDSISLTNSGYNWVAGRIQAEERGESFSFRFRSGIDDANEYLDDFVGFTVDLDPLRETPFN